MQIVLFDKFCEVPRKNLKQIVLLIISSMVMIFTILCYKNIRNKYIEPYRYGYNNWTRYGYMASLGALDNFLIDVGLIINADNTPEDYSKETINEIYEKYNNYEIQLSEDALEYDNVILVLLESFIDSTQIENLELEKDPLENYHKYSNDMNSGFLNVDSIGGGTSNVEFQVLTGYSVSQYSLGIYPYIHCIKRDIETLPRIFKENNYNTTAIHTYKEAFYHRDIVYPKMGIETYISDDDFDDPTYYGQYIDELEISNEIKRLIENEERSFITVTTMGTHVPYTDYNYENYNQYIINDKLNYIEEEKLNNYLQALTRTDQMIGELIEYINSLDEKTLVIMYGDHYPLLYNVYMALGIVENGENNISKDKYPDLFKTPYMIYSNSKNINAYKEISPSDFCRYILENVYLEKVPWYYKVIYEYARNKQNYGEYVLIQYDELFGKQYWKTLQTK